MASPELPDRATSIESYDKKEGGFNRVFVFVLDNGKRIVAKLPFSLAGPPRLITNSEVATVKYLQSKTSIPVPNIIDWNDDPVNAVGSVYIITEHVEGAQLHQRWPSIAGGDKIRFVKSFCRMAKEMVDLEFPVYGSLYLRGNLTSSEHFVPLNDEFCIRPHCGPMFWDCNVGQARFYHNLAPNRGPWPDLFAYCDGLIDAGISRVPPTDAESESRPRYHGSLSAHLKLLEHGRRVIKEIAKDSRVQDAAHPTLLHPDLHKRNIFVAENDPARITGIIDWQSTSIEPAFWHADETPDFAQVHEDESDSSSQLCAKAFEVGTWYYLPRLFTSRLMDEAFFRPFRYCYRTWKDGAVAFRQELVDTTRCWNELGLPGACPFPLPEPDDWSSHQREYRLFEAAQILNRDLARVLDVATDRWAPCDEWERVKASHRETYDGALQVVLANEDPDSDEPLRTEADLREIWPFAL
ncbi:MAG: hypothetical protein M1831_007358 [Alyxoria varia]|nr:MAG: hypothetical protein M1831_007358 [Alyxoria varia]